MTKRTLLRVGVTVMLAGYGTLNLACSRTESNAIHFGAILSLSGAAAPYGQDNQRGIEVAESVLAARGGVRGKRVTVEVQDDAGDPSQSVTLAKRFAADGQVVSLVGPTRTGSTVAVSKILPDLKIPMMSVGATGDWASAAGAFNPWTFRSTRVDTYLITPLLLAARDQFGVHRVAIIYTIDDDWSVSLLKLYQSVADSLGIAVVATESQRTGDTDRGAQLAKINASNPDGIIINTLATDAPTIAGQARRLGIRARFLGTAGFTNTQTWSLAGPGALEGTIVADNYYMASDRQVVRDFVAAYRAQFKADPPPYAAYAFDGVMLLAEACGRATNCSDRDKLRQALGSITDFEGVLGKLSYHGSGDAMKTPFILQIIGDHYSLVK